MPLEGAFLILLILSLCQGLTEKKYFQPPFGGSGGVRNNTPRNVSIYTEKKDVLQILKRKLCTYQKFNWIK